MRLLHVIDTLSPSAGGPPEGVRHLIRAYRSDESLGLEAEILCLDKPDAPFLEGTPCPVHALGQRALGRYAFSPRLWQWLHRNATRFDAIIMHGIWSFPGIAVRFAARRSRTPYSVFVHGALGPRFKEMYPIKHLKKSLYWPIQYTVLRDAAAVFFTTAVERDLAETSFRPSGWNGMVVPYGITDCGDSIAASARQIEHFYARMPALRGRSYLLFIGRIHEIKGCDLLLEAFARLADTCPDVQLVIAGPDQVGLQSKLQAQAEQLGVAARVHWPGMIHGDLKWGALRTCEAFVLPSHHENFGISVVEALSVGRPVLITNQVNIWPEIQADGVGLIDDDTLEGTTRLLRRWFDLSPAERDGIAVRARLCFLTRYSMNRTASAIHDFFALNRDERATRQNLSNQSHSPG